MPPAGSIGGRARRPGRESAFGRRTYRRRNAVERGVDRLKRWRGVAARFSSRAADYRAMAATAELMIWLGA